MARILDRLTTIFDFNVNSAGLRKVERGVKRLQDGLNKFSSAVAVPGAVLSAGVGKVVKTFYDFEVAQNQLQATLLTTKEAMIELRDQAKQLGGSTQFSASQVTEAQNQLAQAGLDMNQILKATPGVLNLAAAGQLSMAESAKITTNQISAFGLSVEDTTRVADVLALAAAKSNTNVRELGPAFRQVAPLARKAGLSIEETAAFIGTLRNQGFAAEQSGTALRAVLARLSSATGPVADTLQELGLDPEFIKSEVAAGRLGDVLGTLKEKTISLEQANILFGQEAAASGLALIDNRWQIIDLTAAYKEAIGTSEKMAKIQNQDVVGSVRNLISAFERLQTEIGEAGLGQAIDTVAGRLTELANWLSESEDGVKKLIAIALGAGPALLALGAAARGISFALGGLGLLANPIGLLAVLIGLIVAAVVYWEEITVAMEAAAKAFLEWLGLEDPDPFGWLTRAYENLKTTLSSSVTGFLGWATAVVVDPFGWLTQAWDSLLGHLKAPAQGLSDGATGIFTWIGDQWDAALDGAGWASSLFTTLRDAVAGTSFGAIGTTIGEAVGNALVLAASGLSNLVAMLTTAVSGIDFNAVGTDIGAFIGEALVNRAAGLANFISSLATTVSGLDFASIGNSIGDGIGTLVVAQVAALTGLLAGFETTIAGFDFSTIGADIGTAIRVALVGAAVTLTGFLTGMAAKVGQIDFGSIGKTIGRLIRTAFLASIDLISALFTGLDEDADSKKWIDLGTKLGKAILDAMAAVLLGFGDVAQGIFDSVIGEKQAEGFQNAYQRNQERLAKQRAERAGLAIPETVGDGVEAGAASLEEPTKGVLGRVRDLLPFSDAREGPLSDLTASGRALMETIAEGVRMGSPSLNSALVAGLGAPLPVGPPPAAMQALAASAPEVAGAGARNVTLNVERIEILAEGGDPQQIAGRIYGALEDELRRAVEVADTRVVV